MFEPLVYYLYTSILYMDSQNVGTRYMTIVIVQHYNNLKNKRRSQHTKLTKLMLLQCNTTANIIHTPFKFFAIWINVFDIKYIFEQHSSHLNSSLANNKQIL